MTTPFWGPDFDQLSEQDPEIASIILSELDRQLNLNESVLRTKVMRTDKH